MSTSHEVPDTQARLESAIPVLPSLDLARTEAFYARVLGFVRGWREGDRVGLRRDDVELQFWQSDDASFPKNSGCRLHVRGIDALHDVASAAGCVHPNAPLGDRPWGYREFALVDPDSNIVVLAERIGQA